MSYPEPRPFLKWAGGKRSLLPEILERMGEAPLDDYVEPFLGGGAVFFELARLGRIRRAVLADRNEALINAYIQVRDDVDGVLAQLHEWDIPENKDDYYRVRSMVPAEMTPTARAARLLWLNRTGFNGLYRVNKKGVFNVPFGRHRLTMIVDEPNLRECSKALGRAGVEIRNACFEDTLGAVPKGAFVYCDPPYWPVSATAKFVSYDQLKFGAPDQERLNTAFRALPDRGARGLLSNSKVPETVALYAGLRCDEVFVRRSINRDANGRGAVPELLVSVG